MTEINLAYEPVPSRIDILARWFPRVAVAIVFISIGSGKFGSESQWIEMFDRIGLGQWLRYGIALIAITLAGAVWTWLAVVGEPFSAVIPAAVLVVLLIVALGRR